MRRLNRQSPPSDACRAIAADGLPTRLDGPGHLSRQEFTDLLIECQIHRVLGLLAVAVDQGRIGVTPEQRIELTETVRIWASGQVATEQLLLRASTVLDAEGIDFRVLKGVALAHSVYRPEQRSFGDVDVIVGTADFSRSASALTHALGMTRSLPELRPGFDQRFGREITMRFGKLEVDLHRAFVDGVFGLRIPSADMFADRSHFELAGRRLPMLGPSRLFVHACISAAIGNMRPRLMAQRDVIQLALAPNFDLGEVAEVAARWRCTELVSIALDESVRALGLVAPPPIEAWAAGERGSRLDRAMVRMYRNRWRGPAAKATGLVAIPGRRLRWDYSRALLRPSPAYRHARQTPPSD